MVTAVKRLLVGNPPKTKQAVNEQLTRETALATRYRQTIHAHASGGDPFTVAKASLGTPIFRRENGLGQTGEW